jgi:hypothetical protein
MSGDRFMWTIFCDDVRQEVGGKLAYMGIYGVNLLVPNYPAHLLKLCAVMSVRTTATRPPTSVVFKLVRDEDVVYEHAIDHAALKEMIATMAKGDADHRHITVGAVAQIVNVVITDRCMLKARAIVDGEELRGGALELCAIESAPSRSQS